MERWLPIPGHEGRYEVSDHGRVRSVPCSILAKRNGRPWMMKRAGKILRLRYETNGYVRVQLGRSGAIHQVHCLVLGAFVGPRPEGHDGAHGDGIRSNNMLGNLRWATKADNQADRIAHCTALAGDRNPQARLTSTDVAAIRRLHGTKTQTALAEQFGVSQARISKIVRGEAWL